MRPALNRAENKIREDRGFTMSEALVAVAIIVILAVMAAIWIPS